MREMKKATIEELAYYLKIGHSEKKPEPIFFLGAGASRSGGIFLATEIVKDVLDRYSDNPRIKALDEKDKTYANLMDCIGPTIQNTLLKGYIDNSRINVTHIYLAQLMLKGYADYILTVNFDNLMQRALALFNVFPPTYDMAILKDLTTTPFKKKSIVYLHGQHHGLWLLNTKEEMDKVNDIVPPILHRISNERLWIFIGYSGDDPIFDHIKKLGRFDHGLYWVAYNKELPSKKVCTSLLDQPNTNAFLVEGYDSDTFMLKLNSALQLPQPEMLDRPFSSLKEMINGIVDIDDTDNLKGVKQRLDIAKGQIDEAIQQFEHGKVNTIEEIKITSELDLLKKKIIGWLINEDYKQDEVDATVKLALSLNDPLVNDLLSSVFFNSGTDLGKLAETKSGAGAEKLYNQAFEKFAKAIEIKPDMHEAFSNWGTSLGNLAKTKSGSEAEKLCTQAFEKYAKAIEIKPDMHEAFSNWGTYLGKLADTKSGAEAEILYPFGHPIVPAVMDFLSYAS